MGSADSRVPLAKYAFGLLFPFILVDILLYLFLVMFASLTLKTMYIFAKSDLLTATFFQILLFFLILSYQVMRNLGFFY